MPLAECGFPDDAKGTAHEKLIAFDPTLYVDIGFDTDYDHTDPSKLPVLAGRAVPALIDTGASESCIDAQLAESLGLPIVDVMKISGIGGRHDAPVYLAHLFVPDFRVTQYGRFAGVDLQNGGQPHQALIGRTFLSDFIMIYDGVRGQVTLAR